MRGVVPDGKQLLGELNGRCQAVCGNFFDSVPPGGDAYILKNVIHDWDDSNSVVILRNCRQVMAENGKVLLVEMLLPLEGAASLESLMDLNMLVISTGRERTEPEYREILGSAGLRITKIMPTPRHHGGCVPCWLSLIPMSVLGPISDSYTDRGGQL